MNKLKITVVLVIIGLLCFETAGIAGRKKCRKDLPELNVRNLELHLGASKPFSALHISDSHLIFAGENDNESKVALAAKRAKYFPQPMEYLQSALCYARKNDMIVLHTGDLCDFVSEANLDVVKAELNPDDFFICAGNHEYSQYVGEAREDEAYKAQTYDKLQEAYPNDLTFSSRIINGVNLVAIDNVYYNITERQWELMKAEVQKGLPIVLLCHVPFYTEEQCLYGQKGNTASAAYLIGAPESVTSLYDKGKEFPEGQEWRNRSIQQKSDETTLAFIDWLKCQELLKVILCGHCHYFYEARFSPTAMQYSVGAGYKGDAYVIRFM